MLSRTIIWILFSFLSSTYDEIRAVAKKEGICLEEYGDVLRLHDDNAVQVQPPRTVEEWKSDPSVVSVTDEGLPPGWVKIIRQFPGGKRAIFKSPTKGTIK
jgi:hypothetical protein